VKNLEIIMEKENYYEDKMEIKQYQVENECTSEKSLMHTRQERSCMQVDML
jgi:hypothetical protein